MIDIWKYKPILIAMIYHQTSNISCTWATIQIVVPGCTLGSKIADHSDVVGASPVGAAPTTSSFSTYNLTSRDSAKTVARQDEKHLSVGIWCVVY